MSRFALVTGGSKGIGKALCNRLLSEGWDVIFTYASDEKAANEALAEFNRIDTGKVLILKADVSNSDSIARISEYLKEREITLDAVVFNAGITDRSDFREIRPEDWERVFAANVHFPVFLLQAIDSRIKNGGSITFTGSLMAIHPHSVSLSYGVTKAAVHALVKNLVKFYAIRQIRVNGVAPGFVETDWHQTKPENVRRNIYAKVAAERFADTEEIADVFMLLLRNSYMNGEIIVCDGGYSYK